MSSIYDKVDIYDLLENHEHLEAYKKNWETLLQGKNISSFFDVSIGSESVTLPLCEMDIQLYGLDLNENMLERCNKRE